MERKKKLGLEALKVQSFRTTLSRDEQKAIKGGSVAVPGATSIKIYC